jgi:hypothetical protein
MSVSDHPEGNDWALAAGVSTHAANASAAKAEIQLTRECGTDVFFSSAWAWHTENVLEQWRRRCRGDWEKAATNDVRLHVAGPCA